MQQGSFNQSAMDRVGDEYCRFAIYRIGNRSGFQVQTRFCNIKKLIYHGAPKLILSIYCLH